MSCHGAKGCPMCGRKGVTIDSRAAGDHWRRRYQCSCGVRWSTHEVQAIETGRGCQLVAHLPPAPVVARVTEALQGLIQEINRP